VIRCRAIIAAVDDAPGRDPIETNRLQWDERAPLHVASDFYHVDRFRAGVSTLRAVEIEEVGDVEGLDLLHLQCHFGLDTLSWARRGARVTGLDFSAPAIEAARTLAADESIDARFVCATVDDAVAALAGQTYDVVYTGIGALGWLPDIDRWAGTAAALVRPGGSLYVFEHHPFIGALDNGEQVDDLRFKYAYDSPVDQPMRWEGSGSYAVPDAETVHNVVYEWNHSLGSIVSSLIDHGLVLELLHEHPFMLWRRWPFLVETEPGIWRLPAEYEGRLPLMFSIRARRPG
jgi:2-polyprenyl-3-methyl-5-hydroxy-6-metoxy-1,4-benzoquinol methylase